MVAVAAAGEYAGAVRTPKRARAWMTRGRSCAATWSATNPVTSKAMLVARAGVAGSVAMSTLMVVSVRVTRRQNVTAPNDS